MENKSPQIRIGRNFNKVNSTLTIELRDGNVRITGQILDTELCVLMLNLAYDELIEAQKNKHQLIAVNHPFTLDIRNINNDNFVKDTLEVNPKPNNIVLKG